MVCVDSTSCDADLSQSVIFDTGDGANPKTAQTIFALLINFILVNATILFIITCFHTH